MGSHVRDADRRAIIARSNDDRADEGAARKAEIRLDPGVLRGNAVAWRQRAGALRAVVKANGYGFGYGTLSHALDAVVDGYYVGDSGEFEEMHPFTRRPIAVLLDVPPARIGAILSRGGIPTVSSLAALDAANAWAEANATRARVRVAVRNAIGWSGVASDELTHFATLLAERKLDVELSSHITDVSLQSEQTQRFERVRAAFERANVAVVASDLASSASLANGVAAGYSFARVGAGLFGARFGARVDVRCAITLRAPVVETFEARGQYVGYGVVRAPRQGFLATVRCGYADGFPRVVNGALGILAVGMQFTTVHRPQAVREASLTLVDRDTDLDLLAASAGIAVHQLVTGLGASRAAATLSADGLQRATSDRAEA